MIFSMADLFFSSEFVVRSAELRGPIRDRGLHVVCPTIPHQLTSARSPELRTPNSTLRTPHSELQQLFHILCWPAEDNTITVLNDRPLNQIRMFDH